MAHQFIQSLGTTALIQVSVSSKGFPKIGTWPLAGITTATIGVVLMFTADTLIIVPVIGI